MNILLIEDERHLTTLLQRVLVEESNTVEIAYDGTTGLSKGLNGTYDVIVLDIMLPGCDGMHVCRQLRQRHIQTPILMLTARESVEDRVAGLRAGADDYLIKPFAMKELLARIDALDRRNHGMEEREILRIGDLTLDVREHVARRGEEEIELTLKEFALLEFLMRHPGQVLSRNQIMDHVWSYESDAVSNIVEIYIHYLRDKIDRGYDKTLIKTVRGVGYRITA
jgi:DNA-binding response OmpR family regulator